MTERRLMRVATIVVAFVLATAHGHAQEPARARAEVSQVNFSSEVLPLLRERCVRCHGGVHREGGLSFLTREDAVAPLASGARAVVPGDLQRSEIWRRITAVDESERMPPAGDPLPPEQIELLRRWIAEGARWERHWSFRPVQRPEPPQTRNISQWIRNPVDQFILARLEETRIDPSPEAERRTLVRRLYLDLIGLLPTVEEVDGFCSDSRPDAYERLVDRLLSSPHFGERWGRHWLDQVRYADTDGFEVDGPRKMAWLWRDWVIDSLNDDMPFDQFTVEQIAGDLLPAATPRQQLATGFHRQSLTNREGGIDQAESRYRELVDRVNATGTIWFGLTVGCAQCHDHPYDPITQREYFELLAFFNQTDDIDLPVPANPTVANTDSEQATEKRGKPGTAAMSVGQTKELRATTIYRRGDFLQPGEGVVSTFPRALHSMPASNATSRAPDRLDLARWLIQPENPLPARVAVNQVWIRLFGAGLVRTPNDFGAHGQPPTHPELLEWLADKYRANRWSNKRLIRLVVTSATYRQSSWHRMNLAEADPLNERWHRQNRYRLEAELVHDLSLSAAGLLTRRIGGPSFYPPLDEALTKLSFRSNYVWTTSTGSDRYRRGMYIFYKRTLPHPNLNTFDCPDATIARMQREISNTPLQALITLNNEVFVEAAQSLAQRVLAETLPGDPHRVDYLYRRCLCRLPDGQERQTVEKLLADFRMWYQRHPDEASSLVGSYSSPGCDVSEAAAWVATCNIILNLNEFLTRE